MPDNFEDLALRLSELAKSNRRRQLVPRQWDGIYLLDSPLSDSLSSDSMEKKLLNFGSNDYLGIASEAQTVQTQTVQTRTGSGASALVCGWTPQHEQLARVIAEFESTESAIVFPTGYAAGSGTVATLAQKGDLILSDELNHASLIDGCRLSPARCLVYPHRCLETIHEHLTNHRNKHHRVWIVTDGVFSMDGHVAPLKELCELAERYGASLIVDEAHGTGVLGESGCGVCEALGVKDRVVIRIGTLSKAIGAQGGFVAGPKVLVETLINHCRSLIFSTSLSPAAVAAAIGGFDLIRLEPQRRIHVGHLARRLRSCLPTKAEEPVNEYEDSIPIVPIMTGRDDRTLAISAALADRGFYVPAIRPPTVPEGKSRLRVSLSAAHDEQTVDQLATAIADAFRCIPS